MEKNKESEGEELIAEFLEENSIEFKRHPKIYLKNDDKAFREPDFYLTKYKVYIEFLGQWDYPEHKARYQEKKRVYKDNNVACIYLFPDNLGTLDWMLKRRLREVLLKHHKISELVYYEIGNYISEYKLMLALMGACIYFANGTKWRIIISILVLALLYPTIKKYVQRLSKIKKSK